MSSIHHLLSASPSGENNGGGIGGGGGGPGGLDRTTGGKDRSLNPDFNTNTTSAGANISARAAATAPAGQTSFVIEYIHDTICPFCYIGFRTLLKAIAEFKERHPDAVFEVTCSPFILGPEALVSSHNKYDYYITYRGLPADRIPLWERLGSDVGIRFSWKGRAGNSRNSHKLLRFCLEETPTNRRSSTTFTSLADDRDPPPLYPPTLLRAPDHPVAIPQPRGPDLQMRLLDAITRSFHEEDRDLSDVEVLLDITASVTGFSRESIRSVLDSAEWDAAIDALSQEVQTRSSVRNRDNGPVVAVPTMVIDNQWVYGGFQKVENLVAQFELLASGGKPVAGAYTRSAMVPVAGTADTAARASAIAGTAAGTATMTATGNGIATSATPTVAGTGTAVGTSVGTTAGTVITEPAPGIEIPVGGVSSLGTTTAGGGGLAAGGGAAPGIVASGAMSSAGIPAGVSSFGTVAAGGSTTGGLDALQRAQQEY